MYPAPMSITTINGAAARGPTARRAPQTRGKNAPIETSFSVSWASFVGENEVRVGAD